MNLTNYDDYDWHDEDYTGQPPDDGQLLIAGREPDTDPDDNSVTVLEYGSSTDSDSFMSDEDMDECPDEYLDDCDNLDAVILPYLTGSKPGKKKRKKKHKKKSKKKASASSKGVNLLKLAAFAKGGVQDSKGFEKDVPLYYLLGDYDSDYDKYTDLEGAAEAMKEYPHEVYLMTIDTGYAA